MLHDVTRDHSRPGQMVCIVGYHRDNQLWGQNQPVTMARNSALATYIVNECCEVVQCKVGDIPKQYQGVKVVPFDCFCMPLDEVYSLGQRRNIGIN